MKWQKMRTWTEISLENLEHNYRALRGSIAPDCKLMAVVKANAYGHGAVRVAQKLEELGADMLAVAALDEALELRVCGIKLPILVLGVTPPEFADEVVAHDITQTVTDLDAAKALSDAAVVAGVCAKIHLKVDTGMSRLGVPGFHAEQAAKELAALCAFPNLEAEGIFYPFCTGR